MFKLFPIIVFVLNFSNLSEAAVHHVRSGATGNSSGADWTNAYPQLPGKLVRGDTYYIAAGNYPAYTFKDPVSGTSLIMIIKATGTNHGTNTGWSSSYGSGQAVFNEQINFLTGYYIFDGVYGDGGNPLNYGFRIVPSGANEQRHNLVGIPQMGYADYKITNVTIAHTAMATPGSSYTGFTGNYSQVCIYSNPRDNRYTAENIVISHNYMGQGSSNMLFRNWWNSIIEYNYFDGNWTSSANHGQQVSPGGDCENIIFRGNTFRNSQVFVLGIHKDSNRNWKIYNNLIIGGSMSAAFANADSPGPYAEDNVVNCHFHHNTFVNAFLGGRGAVYVGVVTSSSLRSYAYNNLFYGCTHPRLDNSDGTPNMIEHSNNTFINCSGNITSESGMETGTSNPFLNLSAGDYSLIRATMQGKTGLETMFSTDYKGSTRGADGVWDRGAYEFQGAPQTANGTLKKKNSSENYIELLWEPVSQQSDLLLEVSPVPFTSGVVPLRTMSFNSGSSPATLRIDNLQPGKRYYFAVSHNSTRNNLLNCETLAAFRDDVLDVNDPFIERDPDSLLLASVTNTIKFAWSDWSGLGGISYRVRVTDASSGTAVYQGTVSATSVSCQGTPGRSYKAEVWPLGSAGQELAAIQSRTILCAPQPPAAPGRPELEE